MKRNERVSATKKINQSNIKILNGTLWATEINGVVRLVRKMLPSININNMYLGCGNSEGTIDSEIKIAKTMTIDLYVFIIFIQNIKKDQFQSYSVRILAYRPIC